jgi:hypothetical protein
MLDWHNRMPAPLLFVPTQIKAANVVAHRRMQSSTQHGKKPQHGEASRTRNLTA